MNDRVMDLLMDRMTRTDSRRGVRGSGRRDRRDMAESHDLRDYEDGYADGYADARRGVKGTGPYGRRDRADEMDHADGHKGPLYLSKEDIREWKRMLENNDGTKGPHYEMSQIMSAADKLGVKFDEFTEAEFCMTVNMFYSDYCDVAKKYVSHDKMLEYFVDMAYGFLCDIDGPESRTKLMLYYHCIVNG